MRRRIANALRSLSFLIETDAERADRLATSVIREMRHREARADWGARR